MATRTWIGNAPYVQHVRAYLFAGTWEADDINDITMGAKTVTVTTGSTTISVIIDTIVTTWNALSATSYPEFAQITASRSSNTLLLTMKSAYIGTPVSCTIATRDVGGAADLQTIDGATTSTGTDSTANSGPNVWNIASNWAEAAVPVDADDIVIDRGSIDILWGLEQSAVEPTSLAIKNSYTGKIGLPTRNSGGFAEHRTTYLEIGPVTLNIGDGVGSGSGRLKINCQSDQTIMNVYGTGASVEAGVHALSWKGTHASNVVNVYGGDVGVATFSGETAVIATLRQTGGVLECSSGVTLTTINKLAGTLTTNSAATTVTNDGGDATLRTGAHTTINANGGTVNYNSTGTITTLTINNDCVADFSGSNQAVTVTSTTVNDNGQLFDPSDRITFTNPIAWKGRLRVGVK